MKNCESFLEGLNTEQRLAATSIDGAVRLIAGAGSGKTHTLSRRVGYICAKKNINPSRVLSLTFTNKAAAEMRSRVANLLELPEESFNMSTFHSLALDIVKRDCKNVFGWDTFRIAQLTPSMLVPMFFNKYSFLLDGRTDAEKEDIKTYLLGKVKNALTYTDYVRYLDKNYQVPILDTTTDFVDAMYKDKEFLKVYKSVKDKIKKEEDAVKIESYYKEYENSIIPSSELKAVNSWVINVIQLKKGICCFDDIINCALYMLKNYTEVQEYWSNQFDYIQVDEFQDTDSKQLEIVQLLYKRHGNLFVVGDPDQSIYIFRGAEPSLFNNLDDFIPNLKTIFMTTNYRSTSEIVDVSNNVIELNKNRIDKTCKSKVGAGSKVKVLIGDNNSKLSEIEFDEIKGLIAKGVDFNDIAILYRSVKDTSTQELQNLLQLANYPIISTLKFKNVFEDATINLCKYRYSKETAFLVSAAEYFGDNSDIHSTKMVDLDAFEKVELKVDDIFNLFDSLKRKFDKRKKIPTPVKEYQTFLDNADNIKESIKNALSNWEKLSDAEKDEKCIVNLLDEEAEFEDGDGIKIMTMHKSKGLEFPYVFVNSLSQSLLDKSMDNAEEHEEKARLAYVAYSRAKKQLYLGCDDIQGMHGVLGKVANMPELECADSQKDSDFRNQRDVALSSYSDMLDRKTSIIYYRLKVKDEVVGYRCVMSIHGEKVAYQAKIEDLIRLNCVPTEKKFLVTVAKRSIHLNECESGSLLSNDEINATIRVKNLRNDNDILKVFAGSNAGFSKDVKDINYLEDLIKNEKRGKSPFARYAEKVKNDKLSEKIPEIVNKEHKKEIEPVEYALIINQNDTNIVGIRMIRNGKYKDISIEKAKEKGISRSQCKSVVYVDEKSSITYENFMKVNSENKCANLPLYHIESVDLRRGTCFLKNVSNESCKEVKIFEVVHSIGNRKIILKNPSALSLWKNWKN